MIVVMVMVVVVVVVVGVKTVVMVVIVVLWRVIFVDNGAEGLVLVLADYKVSMELE